ncbi:hypothetical protein GJW-30_1_03360 [Variibacter gotjawalensis]|uniref:Uncharacterized protein n=1 Tax=Variibacter gotjawalensis TaxID=1333996 RepID=A0A0S3PXY2_9BRAD|nr:hypothetical protein [Variibacter gotjawalensis]NIK46645.1 hypothetical protein [Variibacter gotjawalensis]RZS48548.1 hypothetical protein EV661_0963 [Variibacter gotjawalensis]BAT60810.1 hypothetical protein GJW-30_1_03360 [Variibacter gotjawalensis]
MRFHLVAAATAAFLALPLSAGAATLAPTDMSAQSVYVGPGGVRVGPDHRRWESRGARRDRRCRTEVRTVERRGRTVTTRSRVCD